MLTLALGIGANTAIFSVVNGVVLKPLFYAHPERLQVITSQFPGLGFDRFWVSVPEYVELKQRNRSFDDVGGYREGSVNLGTPDRPRRVNSALVTPELLNVLGVPPYRGRTFTEQDSRVGAEDVAVISYDSWKNDFGSDPEVVGRTLPVDGTPTRIVGTITKGSTVIGEFTGRRISSAAFQAAGEHAEPGRDVWLKDDLALRRVSTMEAGRAIAVIRAGPSALDPTTTLLQQTPTTPPADATCVRSR